MKSRRLLALLIAVAALTVAAVGVALASPARQEDTPETQAEESRASSAYLGIVVRPLSDQAKERLGLPADFQGVIVTGVERGSPAAEAGLQVGDAIFSAAGVVDIAEPNQLARVVAGMKPGDVLTLRYIRDGARNSVDVVLGSLERDGNGRGHHPVWLRKAYAQLHLVPNMVDATVHVIGRDGEVHEYKLTVGSIASISNDGVLALTKRDGETQRFKIGDDTIIMKNGERVRLAALEEGERAMVLEHDGVVAAVIVGPFRPAPVREIGPRPLPHMREAVQERLRALQEKHRELREAHLERMGEAGLSMRLGLEHLEDLKDRYPEHAERIQELIDRLQERLSNLPTNASASISVTRTV